MNKRGGVKLILFFVLIILFLYFSNYRPDLKISKNENILTGRAIASTKIITPITGYTTADIQNIIIQIAHINSQGGLDSLTQGPFYLGDMLGCQFSFNTEAINVSFYNPETTDLNNPIKKYENISNFTIINETICDFSQDAHTCTVIYTPLELKSGEWKCLAQTQDVPKISAPIIMENRRPILTRDIDNITLGGEAGSTISINLNDYFQDPDNQTLTFAALNYAHITVDIESDGNTTFTNSDGYNGIDSIMFRAYDGSIGTFSNNIQVRIGSGIATPISTCNILWDCTTWAECINEQQTRICTDIHNCENDLGKPVEIQTCTAQPLQTNTGGETSTEQITSKGTEKVVTVQQDVVSGTLRTILLIMIILLGLGLLLFVSYIVIIKLKTKELQEKNPIKQEEQPIQNQQNLIQKKVETQARTINLIELQKYIKNSLEQKIQEIKIKADLLSAGWKKEDIDNAINIVKLRIFVDQKIKQGFNEEQIRQTLISKGWKKEILEEVFNTS